MLVFRDGQEPVLVRTGNEPFQVSFLIAIALWGVSSLLTLSSVTTTTTRSIPLGAAYVFFAFLTLGCVLTVTGVVYQVFRKRLTGLYLERAGLYVLLGFCSAYTVWAFAASGVRALGFGLLMSAVVVGSLWRVLRIRYDLRAVTSDGAP